MTGTKHGMAHPVGEDLSYWIGQYVQAWWCGGSHKDGPPRRVIAARRDGAEIILTLTGGDRVFAWATTPADPPGPGIRLSVYTQPRTGRPIQVPRYHANA